MINGMFGVVEDGVVLNDINIEGEYEIDGV